MLTSSVAVLVLASDTAAPAVAPDWLGIVERVGVPLAVAAGMGWFGVRMVWPFVIAQVASAQQARAVEHEHFIAALERRDEALGKILNKLDAMHEDMRRYWRTGA